MQSMWSLLDEIEPNYKILFFFLFKINSQVPLEEVTPLLKCSPVVKPTSVIKYNLNRTLRGLGEGRGESVFVWVLWITSPERGFFPGQDS